MLITLRAMSLFRLFIGIVYQPISPVLLCAIPFTFPLYRVTQKLHSLPDLLPSFLVNIFSQARILRNSEMSILIN